MALQGNGANGHQSYIKAFMLWYRSFALRQTLSLTRLKIWPIQHRVMNQYPQYNKKRVEQLILGRDRESELLFTENGSDRLSWAWHQNPMKHQPTRKLKNGAVAFLI